MLSSVDFYRRVPKDLTEVSQRSSLHVVSILHWENNADRRTYRALQSESFSTTSKRSQLMSSSLM